MDFHDFVGLFPRFPPQAAQASTIDHRKRDDALVFCGGQSGPPMDELR